MRALDQFIEGSKEVHQESCILALRKLAVNKDIRIFLTALCKYSKADWASFVRSCRILQGVMQSSLLIKEDSALMEELMKTPHIAVFIERLGAEY